MRNSRKAAETELGRSITHSNRLGGVAKSVGIGSKRIGWALLDVADAIREHAEATRRAAGK